MGLKFGVIARIISIFFSKFIGTLDPISVYVNYFRMNMPKNYLTGFVYSARKTQKNHQVIE